jgi:choline dehydrogenase-like flavoprotein
MLVTKAFRDGALDRETYDYVIVGAGAAGCALAAALTDRADCSVMLIEAGKYYGRLDQYPELLQRNDRYAFSLPPGEDYSARPSYAAHVWSYEGRLNAQLTARVVRGRVVGGSSAVNGASFLRGRTDDYDA